MSDNPFIGKDTFLFDGDGVLYKEDSALPGAIEFLTLLQKKERKIFILTNNSTKTRKEFQAKLENLGIKIPIENILTSAYLTADYFSKQAPNMKVYIIGEEGLKEEFRNLGLKVINSGEESNDEAIFDFDLSNVDCVVTGMDRKLTYVKLARAINILTNKNKETKFIATNGDMTFPTKQGLIPGGGAMITMLEELAGRKVELVIGKPSPQMYISALEISGSTREEAVFFGDRIETDIIGANQVGIMSCLVLSGVTSMDDLENLSDETSPDIIVNNLQDVIELFENL
ncbi:MAG: HAD-IIA family hydrolase [Candidatus Heimdallarchaeota archaeon]|nr:HAD-IIA family hydrolase [Candidatus Heimdallarchaeota archaeon]MCK4877141.1 HAD-IIA family hydrolase [Candidatus Heimdallarchaeota archaeon]